MQQHFCQAQAPISPTRRVEWSPRRAWSCIRNTPFLDSVTPLSFPIAGPLAGCYFTLVALRVYGSEGEEERVKETILLSGGRVGGRAASWKEQPGCCPTQHVMCG